MKNNRLYVIVRKNLLCSSPAVQAGHIVAEFCLNSPDAKLWDNQYLIYLEVPDTDQLYGVMFSFERRDIDIYMFHEPDNYPFGDDLLTGICGLIDEEDAGFLSDLEMLT